MAEILFLLLMLIGVMVWMIVTMQPPGAPPVEPEAITAMIVAGASVVVFLIAGSIFFAHLDRRMKSNERARWSPRFGSGGTLRALRALMGTAIRPETLPHVQNGAPVRDEDHDTVRTLIKSTILPRFWESEGLNTFPAGKLLVEHGQDARVVQPLLALPMPREEEGVVHPARVWRIYNTPLLRPIRPSYSPPPSGCKQGSPSMDRRFPSFPFVKAPTD